VPGHVVADPRHDLLARMNFERERRAYDAWRAGAAPSFVPLVRDARLEAAAQLHAERMGRHELRTHGHWTDSIHGRIARAGYPCREWVDCSENVSTFDGSAYGVIIDWMEDDLDRANVLNDDWVDVGIGVVRAKSGLNYWCAVFARPHEFAELAFTEDELGELMAMVWPHGLAPEDDDEMRRKFQHTPRVEAFEGRLLMSAVAHGIADHGNGHGPDPVTASLSNGTLSIAGTNQDDSIRVTTPTPATVRLDVRGQAPQVWPASSVAAVAIDGRNGDDSLINLTQIPATITAGNGANYINTGDPSRLGIGANDTIVAGNGDNVIQDSGGIDSITAGNGDNVVFAYGTDAIAVGNGNNVLYNIVGSGTITAGDGRDRVITNARVTVLTGTHAYPTVIFTARPNPVTLNANGTLNFAAATGNTTVTINPTDDGSTITTTYTNSVTGVNETDVFPAASVTAIGAIFGRGTGTFVNNTSIDDVVYGGGGGSNQLTGGSGFNFMKSNSSSDTIDGSRGTSNVLSVGGPIGTLIGGTGKNVLVAGFSGTTVVYSQGTDDALIGDIAVVTLAGKKWKFYS
jgi:hypothetical protein